MARLELKQGVGANSDAEMTYERAIGTLKRSRMTEITQETTDNQLVEMAKTNPDVFGELVKRYQGRLFSYIRRISYFANEDIEDIVQETFIKSYRSLNLFDGDLKFSTWIYQIARNATIDAIRKKQARPQTVFIDEGDVMKLFKSEFDLGKSIEIKDRIGLVKESIENLPYKYKEVLVLRFLEEKTYEEIMDIVQKPKGTVAALINRGRKLLMEEIGGKLENFQ